MAPSRCNGMRQTMPVADENEQEKKNDSLMARAIRAADARRWEEAARFANGLSPSDLRSFIFIYKRNPQFIKQLHIGAINAEGVGDKSAVALATEGTYKEVKHKEDIPTRNGSPKKTAPRRRMKTGHRPVRSQSH